MDTMPKLSMVMPYERARTGSAVLEYNGGGDDALNLFNHLQSVEYTDPASGSSDELQVTLYNADLEFLTERVPKTGDFIQGSLLLTNWNGVNDNHVLKCGKFLVDDVKFSGGPSQCILSCVSKPADTSWATRRRTQVWENATVAGIAGELASRNGLALSYKAPTYNVTKIEQSQKTDQAFLKELCENNDLGMKVFETKLVIFGWGELEGQEPIAELNRDDFVDDSYEYHDTLAGVYTGAEIAYKNGDNNEEIRLTVGDPTRQLYINETADTAAEADRIARAQVNASNRSATTFAVGIWPRPDITSGTVIKLKDLGVMDGLYFVDTVVISMGESGTQMSVETHKCQPRL